MTIIRLQVSVCPADRRDACRAVVCAVSLAADRCPQTDRWNSQGRAAALLTVRACVLTDASRDGVVRPRRRAGRADRRLDDRRR